MEEYIKRSDIEREYEETLDYMVNEGRLRAGARWLKANIDAIEPADVIEAEKIKNSYWIVDNTDPDNVLCLCKACKYNLNEGEPYNYKYHNYSYCPHCGAIMTGAIGNGINIEWAAGEE